MTAVVQEQTKTIVVAGMLPASQISGAISKQHTARMVRVAQLEQFIRDHGLEVPPYKQGWEIAP